VLFKTTKSSAMKNKLKIERALRAITQEELAKQVGVTRQAVNAVELNKNVPSTILALKLSRFFNKTVNELFSLEESD
jgi:putative transcriptional regulator